MYSQSNDFFFLLWIIMLPTDWAGKDPPEPCGETGKNTEWGDDHWAAPTVPHSQQPHRHVDTTTQ